MLSMIIYCCNNRVANLVVFFICSMFPYNSELIWGGKKWLRIQPQKLESTQFDNCNFS